MPRRRLAIASLLTALVAAPLVHAPAVAEPSAGVAPRAAARAVLTASLPNVIPGEQVTFVAGAPKGKAFVALPRSDRRRAKLVLQRKVEGQWRRIGVRRLTTRRVSFTYAAPASAAGTILLRTVATLKKRQYLGGRLALPVVAQQLSATPSTLSTAAPIDFSTSLTPARTGRPVTIQVHQDGQWVDAGAPVASGGAGSATATAQSPAYPVWYRVVGQAWNGAPAIATAPVRTTFTQPVPGVIAHRAGAGAAPEQTLAAVRQALADGAPAMEVDVQLTQDEVLVIHHDKTLARTTNVEQVFPDRAPWNLADFNLSEIKQLDAGSWFGPQFAGETIPTLDELLIELDQRAHLVIEVKSPGDAGNALVDENLVDALVGGHLKDLADAGKLSFSSFDVPWLQDFDARTPMPVPVGVLTTLAPTTTQLDEWKAWAQEVHPQYALAGRATIDGVRARGMTSSVWTVNSVEQFRAALGLGADRIITDYPRRLAEVLNPPAPAA